MAFRHTAQLLVALCSALLTLACLPALAQQPAEGPEGGDSAVQPPAAYTLSFRIIKIDVAEGYDQRVFADLPDGVFLQAPPDGDGFYDRAFLREMYGEAIRRGLVAIVGPVYSMTVAPGAEMVTTRNVTRDGTTEWSMSHGVDPLTPDGMSVRLRSLWSAKDFLAFEMTGPEPATCDVAVGQPFPVCAEQGRSGGYVVLVLVEPAVM